MKIPFLFGKPRWQSTDAQVRRAAIASDHDAELIAALPQIVRTDADPRVRAAALLRLADPGIAQGVARDDADADVRATARTLWLDLLAGAHADAPPLAERLRLLRAQDDAATIEHLARHARDAELRHAALARVDRPGFLAERALEEPDARMREALVDRIDDADLLARIAERARRSDKATSRRARERIEALRIERGDADAVARRARQLCEHIERVLREAGTQDEEAGLVRQWNALAHHAPEHLRQRFEAARTLLEASRAPRAASGAAGEPQPIPVETPAPATDASPLPSVPEPPAPAPPLDPAHVAAPILAQARFAASIDEAQQARRQEEAQRREQERARLRDLQAAIAECAAALDAGASARAHAAKARIDELRKQATDPLPAALVRELAALEPRYAELARWQYWADNERRRQIVEEIEALPQAELHPDAVAAKVRDAQAEWSRLDSTEGPRRRTGDLSRRFHAACRAALAPAQAYFRKRQELRRETADELAALLARIEALPAETPARELAASRNALREALRALDQVEPRVRKELVRRIKASLETLEARIAAHDDAIAQVKDALIAQANALADAMPSGAAAAARALQQQWKEAGNGRRARDQKQWTAFRGAIDRVFGNLDALRAERNARESALRDEAAAVCAEFEALVDARDVPDRAAIAAVQKRWDELASQDPALRRRHDAARERLAMRRSDAERRERNLRFERWHARHTLCRAVELGTRDPASARAEWGDMESGAIASDTLLARIDGAGDSGNARDAAAFMDALLALEMLAGIEPGNEDRERRRRMQVERLAARMRGGDAASPAEEFAGLLARWAELGPPPAAIEQRFERAFAAALANLP